MKWADYAANNGIEQCIRDKNGYIVAWCVGYSDDELKNLLKRHPGWYFSSTKIQEENYVLYQTVGQSEWERLEFVIAKQTNKKTVRKGNTKLQR